MANTKICSQIELQLLSDNITNRKVWNYILLVQLYTVFLNPILVRMDIEPKQVVY